jgi:glycine/D-amino acid oxidase-like deaminating enzyme
MNGNELFAAGYKQESYWWEAAPLAALPETKPPAAVDLVIVGSGYTGLAAALVAARGGRSVLVLEAERAGHGCSTRNGGQVSTSIKPDYATLSQRHGAAQALEIRREGIRALDFIAELIEREHIDCDWEVNGRFHAAHNPQQYEALAQALAHQAKGQEVPYEMVPRSEQRREIGSDRYFGGVVYPRHAQLHPGKYHAGLLAKVREAGATVIDRTRVEAVERDGQGFSVRTAKGSVKARDVLIASNGYTGPGTPWFRRRVIPIGSYIIATEPLEPKLATELVPHARSLSDTRKLVFYYRLSPDRRRMLFGGRVAYNETDANVSAPRLHDAMCAIYPQLKSARISHSWLGFVAYTFDTMPHIGRQDGLWYAMGYCGSGVSLATYFGTRIGQQILGQKEGATPLDGLAFPTRPLYTGYPWFLAPSIFYYRMRDRLPV